MSSWKNNANITLTVRSVNKRKGLEWKYGKDQSLSNKRLPIYTVGQGHCQHSIGKSRLACLTFDHGTKSFPLPLTPFYSKSSITVRVHCSKA